MLYKDPSGNIPAVIIYVASKAPEIFLDVVLDYTISEITGEEFSTWKSALANSALDLLPIVGKINTGKKVSKIIDIIGKEGLEKLRVAAGKAAEMMKRGNIDAGSKYLDNVIQEIVEGAGKVSLKKIKNNKEANKLAKKLGYDGAEELKKDFVGRDGAKFDIKYDSKTGEIYLESIRDGVQVATGMFKK